MVGASPVSPLPDFDPEAKDLQSRFDIARLYREHVDQVGSDRALEEWMQAFWF